MSSLRPFALQLRARSRWAAFKAQPLAAVPPTVCVERPVAGKALRKLAVATIVTPILTGILVLLGLRADWYQSHFAPAIWATLSAAAFMGLAFRSAAVLAHAEADMAFARAAVQNVNAELEASVERHLALVQGLPQLVWTCLPDGVCNYLSPQWVYYTGIPENEQLGFGWLAQIHPDDAQRSHAHWLGAVAGNHPYDIEYRIRGGDGIYRWFKTRGTPIQNGEGLTTYWFGTCTDIQEIVEAREVLARSREALQAEVQARIAEAVQSEARYRLLAENATDVIGRYALDGELLYISPACRDVLGFEPEELIGRRTIDLIHPDDRDRVRAQFARHLALPVSTAPMHTEHRVLRKDGGVIWLEGRPRLMLDAVGAAAEYQDVMRDITARKAMEAELEEARLAAEAAVRAKGDFLANMSHELRTPLTAILGYSEALAGDERLFDEGRDHVIRVRDAGASLLTLVDDVLDLAKIEASGVRLQTRPTELGALLRSSLNLVQQQAAAKALQLNLDWQLADLTVDVDPDRLRQVLLNLLGNAVKFTPAGCVALKAICEHDGAYAALEVAVSDTGVGISPDRLLGVFGRFEQADASTSRRFGGTGLGLTISRAIMEAMGGRIEVASRLGEGSTFTLHVRLPLAKAAPAPVAMAVASGTEELRGLRVLLAEDVAVNRQLISLFLKPFGVELEMACDGRQAVDAAENASFDLILMDMQMPLLDGVEATRRIRTGCGPSATAPILALTANILGPEIESCLGAGMDGHIGKPFTASQLVSAIRDGVRERAERKSASA